MATEKIFQAKKMAHLGILFLNSTILFAAKEPIITPSRPTPPIIEDGVLFDEGSVLDQVIMESQAPKIYDWRNSNYELELGIDGVNERNVIPSDGWHAGVGFSLGGGFLFRTGLRRISVHSDTAGRMIAKTPFRQIAQPTRWEVYGQFGYSLLEGKSSSRLSPIISDVESVFSLEAGVHYVHPSSKFIPTKKGDRARVAGQTIGVSAWVIDLGLRYQIYLPSGFGLFFLTNYQIPRSYMGPALGHWTGTSIGGVVAFGDKRRP